MHDVRAGAGSTPTENKVIIGAATGVSAALLVAALVLVGLWSRRAPAGASWLSMSTLRGGGPGSKSTADDGKLQLASQTRHMGVLVLQVRHAPLQALSVQYAVLQSNNWHVQFMCQIWTPHFKCHCLPAHPHVLPYLQELCRGGKYPAALLGVLCPSPSMALC